MQEKPKSHTTPEQKKKTKRKFIEVATNLKRFKVKLKKKREMRGVTKVLTELCYTAN